jgi:hypothetical protein
MTVTEDERGPKPFEPVGIANWRVKVAAFSGWTFEASRFAVSEHNVWMPPALKSVTRP